MRIVSRHRRLAAWAYETLNVAVAAAMTHSPDPNARRLARAALSTGVGVPAGFGALRDLDGSLLFDLDDRILYEAA